MERKSVVKKWIGWILCLWLLGGCNQLFYAPTDWIYSDPKKLGFVHEDVTFTSADGVSLHGWFVPAKEGPAKGTVVHFHGNGENLTSYWVQLFHLPANGYHLFLFDYRGYGRSEGQPTPEGVVADGVAALEYLKTRPDVNPNKLIVFGQSLGGAVALRVMGTQPRDGIVAIVVEGAFYSYQSIAEDKLDEMSWPLQWLKSPLSHLLIDDSMSPAEVIANIAPTPLLVVHGKLDRIVPFHHGEQIFAAAQEPKWMWTMERGRHLQMLGKYRSIYKDRFIAFLDERVKESSSD